MSSTDYPFFIQRHCVCVPMVMIQSLDTYCYSIEY